MESKVNRLPIPLLSSVLLIALLLIASCGNAQPTTPTTTTPTMMTTPTLTTTTPTTTTTAMTTWGELAQRGRGSFVNECGSCHGEDGQGGSAPQIIGQNLTSYTTAQALFNFISREMPQDAPGTLPEELYLRILAYMLIESGLIQPEAILDRDNLVNVFINE